MNSDWVFSQADTQFYTNQYQVHMKYSTGFQNTNLFNLQCNNVALQVAAICCSHNFTFTVKIKSILQKQIKYKLKICFSKKMSL